jgi:hypothetical protein
MEVYSHYHKLGIRWKLVVIFTARPIYPRETDPGTHCIGGRVGPIAGMDIMKRKHKSLAPAENRIYSKDVLATGRTMGEILN